MRGPNSPPDDTELELVLGRLLRGGVLLAALVSAAGLILSRAVWMKAGLFILVATPVARVAFSVVGFALARDRLYVAVTLLVLALLAVSLFG
jgi:uncharacterized membrane protein